MSDKQVWLCVILYFLFIAFIMFLDLKSKFVIHAKRKPDNTCFANIKATTKDFLNGPASKAFAVVVLVIFLPPYLLISVFIGALFPLVLQKVLCIISGIVCAYYFLKTCAQTAKDIKKNGIKAVVRINWQGVVSIFVFLLFLFAYGMRINN